MSKVEKLSTVPSAFSAIAEKVNEVIAANPLLIAGAGIKIIDSEENRLIAIDVSSQSSFASLLVFGRTFYTSPSGSLSCVVTAGTINNVLYSGGTFNSLVDGNKIYIDATLDAGGTVTALTVSKGSSVPSSTSTHAYTLIGSVTVTSGIAAITAVAWNYSQVERCGGSTYYWGGFGS